MACLGLCGLLTLPGFFIEEVSEVEKLAAQTGMQRMWGEGTELADTFPCTAKSELQEEWGGGTELTETSPRNEQESESSERTAKRLQVKSAGLHVSGSSALAARN